MTAGLTLKLSCLALSLSAARAFAPARSRVGLPVLNAVWSNPRAILDYQDYLNGVEEEESSDQASLIVRGGQDRLADGLAQMGGGGDVVVDGPGGLAAGIGQMAAKEASFPIYLCVRASELEEAIMACPEDRKDDLVIMSRGMIEPVTKKHGVASKQNTQALVNFDFNPRLKPIDLVADMGTDVRGEPKFALETCVKGKWAGAFKERLDRNGVHCKVEGEFEFRRSMIELLLFDTIFAVVGALHGDSTIGQCGEFYMDEVDDLAWEMSRMVRGHLALTLLFGVEERFLASSESIKQRMDSNRRVEDEWEFFAGYFMNVIKMYEGKPIKPLELFAEYIELGVERDCFTLPQ